MGLFESLFGGGRTDIGQRSRVPRNWENLPSMVVMPVPASFSYPALARLVQQEAPDKQLVCLVGMGWTTSPGRAFQDIQLLYEFADDPSLVLMKFPSPARGREKLIIRASFIQETMWEVEASSLHDLADHLSRAAKSRGLRTTAVT